MDDLNTGRRNNIRYNDTRHILKGTMMDKLKQLGSKIAENRATLGKKVAIGGAVAVGIIIAMAAAAKYASENQDGEVLVISEAEAASE